MTVSLATVGAFFLGLYLISIGLTGLFGFKIPSKLVVFFALIAGICILLGVFVTKTLVIN